MGKKINWTVIISVFIVALLFFVYSFCVRCLPICKSEKPNLNPELEKYGKTARKCYDERKSDTGFSIGETSIVSVSEEHSGYYTVKLFVQDLNRVNPSQRIADHCVILYVDPKKMECKPTGTLIAADCSSYNFVEYFDNEKIAKLKIPFYKDYEIEIETYS